MKFVFNVLSCCNSKNDNVFFLCKENFRIYSTIVTNKKGMLDYNINSVVHEYGNRKHVCFPVDLNAAFFQLMLILRIEL